MNQGNPNPNAELPNQSGIVRIMTKRTSPI